MTGVPWDKVKKNVMEASAQLSSRGYVPVSPLDICHEGMSYAQCMGRDINVLLEQDAVCFCPGWYRSKGCLLEMAAAIIYRKRIMFK